MRKPEEGLSPKTFHLWAEQKAHRDAQGVWHHHLSGNCERALVLSAHDMKQHFVKRHVRCRKCSPCLRARSAYWALAGVHQTELASGRTWFGTLTLSPSTEAALTLRAREKNPQSTADWFLTEERTYWCRKRKANITVLAYPCDLRFKLVCAEMYLEVQRYFKRLRKEGHCFTYLAVFEQHKTGLPHVHLLVHEQGAEIRKARLQAQWDRFGFSNFKLVGAKRSKTPEQAAWYVSKYLSKSMLTRVKASQNYVPSARF